LKMHGESGKGSRRRREDAARVRRNWPWPDRPPPRWDESDPDHPRHHDCVTITDAYIQDGQRVIKGLR
jgi:hypothetical protein